MGMVYPYFDREWDGGRYSTNGPLTWRSRTLPGRRAVMSGKTKTPATTLDMQPNGCIMSPRKLAWMKCSRH